MFGKKTLRTALLCGAASTVILCSAGAANAQQADFNISPQPLATALGAFSEQSQLAVIFTPELTNAKLSRGVSGPADVQMALNELLAGTGLSWRKDGSAFVIVRASDPQSGSAGGDGADGTVQALVVTAQKREENIQDVPIAMSAFTQEALERSQVAGGPDLITQVPNMTFTKTNFSSYSIQIRGIGTQAISATTDAAVAVAFNNTPFIRNRFFEQEFYDLQRVEVLRGPQGTLYGRNATAGVVNIISAKPSFRYEAKVSGDVANYGSTRLEGMLNIPLVENKVALRMAGAWTKRDGYVTNQLTGAQIDGRDLWSTRVSLRVAPTDGLSANLIWEHFQENDDRLRSGKQLCRKHTPLEIAGVPVAQDSGFAGFEGATLSQGCLPASMYSPDAFQTPNGFSLPYYGPLGQIGNAVYGDVDPYVSATQSRDLRVIESALTPEYDARNDLFELQATYELTPGLTIASETAYSTDELFSFEDFNRFNTKPGAFNYDWWMLGNPDQKTLSPDGVFCDPQLGCSDRLVLGDLSTAKSRHFSQEFRLSSDFQSAFNFSLGANFLRYDTTDKYYVFINSLSLWAAGANSDYVGGVTDNGPCLYSRRPGNPNETQGVLGCIAIDPNGIHNLDDTGHNYFLSTNPYKLISYALFGEAYYNISGNLKLTAGLRWTVDKKEAPVVPSWLIAATNLGHASYGHPVIGVVRQDWNEPTGRLALDWKPTLAFTDQTLVYGSFARGYKAGGMNPPPAMIAIYTDEYSEQLRDSIRQPSTFDAEFVNAYELGTKNTLLEGRLTLNLSSFYYDYENYQLSQILNRSAVTDNFDAKVWGLELEADWRPLENLRLGLKTGYEKTRVGDGESAIDLMDRTAGHADWVVMRPFPTVPSNCIMPTWLVTYGGQINVPSARGGQVGPCVHAYLMGLDPVTVQPYVPNPDVTGIGDNGGLPTDHWAGYPGFDPSTAPNNGEGFSKDLSGHELPNAPHYTVTVTSDYTIQLRNSWLATLHTDIYYQSEAWTRIFNMEGYDKLKAYTNVNLAAIFTNEDAGWKVMAYVKNVFDKDNITGAFLNSDDTGLTTNVFLTEPRLYGLRLTKDWTGENWRGLDRPHAAGEPYRFVVELGGSVLRTDAPSQPLAAPFMTAFDGDLDPRPSQQRDLDWGDGREVRLTYQPAGSPWSAALFARAARANSSDKLFAQELIPWTPVEGFTFNKYNYVLSETRHRERHDIVDFTVGRDVGLGAAGEGVRSHLSAGLRYAEFSSQMTNKLHGTPEYILPPAGDIIPTVATDYHSAFLADRSFKGAGPIVSWDIGHRLLEGEGRVDVDGGVSVGVLFGRQTAAVTGSGYSDQKYSDFSGGHHTITDLPPVLSRRETDATVPVVGARLSLSYEIERVKVSGGYRWERYMEVIDGGYDKRAAKDRTIDGPYFKIGVGFGG